MSWLNPTDQITAMVADAPRSLSFDGQDFGEWREAFAAGFDGLLGPAPRRADLAVETTTGNPLDGQFDDDVDCFTMHFDCDAYSRSHAYGFAPRQGWNGRTVLLCHGHDPRSRRVAKHFARGRFDAPFVDHVVEPTVPLLEAGFSVVAPVWRGFKERDGNYESHGLFRDPCNVFGLGFGYAGFTLINLLRLDASRAIDALDALEDDRFRSSSVVAGRRSTNRA